MQKISAVLFDFDGTLVDSEQYYLSCGVKAMVHYGIDETLATSFYQAKLAGIRSDLKPAIFAAQFPQIDYAAYNALYLHYCDTLKQTNPIKIKPGANELLRYLKRKGLKLALVTMSTYDEVQEVCAETGLDFSLFDYYYGGMAVPAKPDPAVYLAAMQAMHVTPEATLIVEDSDVGGLAALRSGATVAVVKDICVLSAEVLQRADYVLEKNCLIELKSLI